MRGTLQSLGGVGVEAHILSKSLGLWTLPLSKSLFSALSLSHPHTHTHPLPVRDTQTTSHTDSGLSLCVNKVVWL